MNRCIKIEKVCTEAQDTKSIYFRDSLCGGADAGQFVMLWLPGIDEIPMSLSRIGNISSVTILKRGDCTEKLLSIEEGEKLFIRGPFGKGFTKTEGEKRFIAGGVGIAPLLPLIDKKSMVFLGGANSDSLPLVGEILAKGAELEIATEDGSVGFKGTVIDLFFSENRERRKTYACGPMEMLREIHARGLNAEAALESFVKCAIGMCDSCSINGFRVCADGPVIKDLGEIW